MRTLPIAGSRKTVLPADLGPITLDCDILAIKHADLHIVLNWAASGSPDAAKLDVLRERVAAAAR